MIDKSSLILGKDIPFHSGGIIIHQPTLSEIASLGEDAFFTGLHLLTISKGISGIFLDKNVLESYDDFHIFMSLLDSKEEIIKIHLIYILDLIFPNYEISYDKGKEKIFFKLKEDEGFGELNPSNYDEFKKYIKEIFCMNSTENAEYNPANKAAAAIAEKLQKAKLNKQKTNQSTQGNTNIIYNKVSALSIAFSKPPIAFLDCTYWMLNDVFMRYIKKRVYDSANSALMAGAKVDIPEDWLIDN
jgi:hypothetical protein